VSNNQQQRLSLVWFSLALILIVAALIRFMRIGALDFGADEILHVFAAKQIMTGGPPILPSGEPYVRALLYTKLLAALGNIVGLDEWTSRLPSVIFGVLTTFLVFLVARTWYSTSAALVSALLTALAPSEIAFSREVRMYAPFQLAFLLTIFLFLQGYESTMRPTGFFRMRVPVPTWLETFEIRPLTLIASGVFLLLATHLHPLMLVAMSGPFTYVVAMAVVSISTKQIRGFAVLKHVVTLSVPALGIIVVYFLDPGLFKKYIDLIGWAPVWAEDDVHNWKYYIERLVWDYPLIFGTLPIVTAYAFSKKPKATFFLACCLGVPLFLQSFVLAWKSDRYDFHLLPIVFLLSSVGISGALVSVYRSLAATFMQHLRPTHAAATATVLVAATVVAGLTTTPWLRLTVKSYVLQGPEAPLITRHRNWKQAMEFVGHSAKPGEAIIAPFPLLASYYGPPLPIYLLNNNFMSDIVRRDLRDQNGNLIDYTARAPLIVDVDSLRNVIDNHSSAWLVMERFRFYNATPTPPTIRNFIESTCEQRTPNDLLDMVIWYCRGSN
jgi:4-amino-4-deoxy-L-arabinose transferase-like glycosyltransferase